MISLNGGLWKTYPNLKGQKTRDPYKTHIESILHISTAYSDCSSPPTTRTPGVTHTTNG